MSLFADVPLSNVTVYRAEYTKKPLKRTEPCLLEPEYKNIISGTLEADSLLWRKCPLDNGGTNPEHTEQMCERSLALRKTLLDGFDCDLIDRLHEREGDTEYMLAYCRLGDYQSKGFLKSRPIPEGWKIEETTHRCIYRDPSLMGGKTLSRSTAKRLVDNLVPNERIRAIFGVKTGETEYMGSIDRTGEEIIKGKLHGDVNIRPQFSQDELLRAMLIRRE